MIELLLSSSIAWIFSGIAVLITFGVVTGYLNGRERILKSRDVNQLRHEFKESLSSMKTHVDSILASLEKPDADERSWMIEEAYLRLKQDSSEALLEDLRQSYTANRIIEDRLFRVSEQKQATIERLRQELFSLGRRGNLNLSIGIITTITGLFLLGYFVVNSVNSQSADYLPKLDVFLIEFVPRLSLVALIEIFAFFFLSLYKTSLSEIKYFQNEVTSIEAKFIALELAALSDSPDQMSKAIESLAKVERNFILSKGQTTVDLERARIEQAERMDITSKMADFFRTRNEK